MSSAASPETRVFHGPYKRLSSATQTPADMRAILRSGQLWGRRARAGLDSPVIQAYRGALRHEQRGFEFYAVAPPVRVHGPHVRWTGREDGLVWIEEGWAKMEVVVSRVNQEW